MEGVARGAGFGVLDVKMEGWISVGGLVDVLCLYFIFGWNAGGLL
jgi:hypothetical protein